MYVSLYGSDTSASTHFYCPYPDTDGPVGKSQNQQMSKLFVNTTLQLSSILLYHFDPTLRKPPGVWGNSMVVVIIYKLPSLILDIGFSECSSSTVSWEFSMGDKLN